jgi:hypothetical protein
MIDMFYSVITFIGGLIGGVVLTLYKYRNYIKIGFADLLEALSDGKLQPHDLILLLIDVEAECEGRDRKTVALDVINFIKQRYNLD